MTEISCFACAACVITVALNCGDFVPTSFYCEQPQMPEPMLDIRPWLVPAQK